MNIPQLRRVIVAYGKHVAMEPTLEEAVRAVFGKAPQRANGAAVEMAPDQQLQLQSAIRDAEQALERGSGVRLVTRSSRSKALWTVGQVFYCLSMRCDALESVAPSYISVFDSHFETADLISRYFWQTIRALPTPYRRGISEKINALKMRSALSKLNT